MKQIDMVELEKKDEQNVDNIDLQPYDNVIIKDVSQIEEEFLMEKEKKSANKSYQINV